MNYFLKILILPAAAAALLPCALGAADTVAPDPRIPAKETVAAVNDITGAIADKNLTMARDIAGKLLASTADGTVDRAYADLLMAQIASSEEKFAEAVPHMEAALATKLFAPADMERYSVGLAHLYMATKQPAKAVALLEAFLKDTPQPQDDTLYMFAGLLMENNRGDEALVQAKRLMERQIDPPARYYQMAAACAQSVKNYDLACAYIERLIEMEPKNELYWNQLVAMHYTAGELVAAIVSLEQAQKQGLLQERINWETHVELYYNLDCYADAAKVIEAGLSSGKLPNELRFWELLSLCYDRLYQSDKAVAVLEKASASTPWSAIDTRLAERNYREGRFDQVVVNLRNALRKGGIERVGDCWALLASAYIELKDYDNADKAVAEAAKYPDAASKVERLNRILKIIRENQKRAAEAKAPGAK